MAETLLSPGVLTRENDQSQITQGPITAGAAIVGQTVKGPVGIPTLVTSYSSYISKFGGAFVTGGTTQEYLTSISTYNYFQQGGTSLLVTRVVNGTFLPASSSAIINSNLGITSASFALETLSAGNIMNSSGALSTNNSLVSGSADNLRFEIVGANTGSGTFSLLIRRGNDTDNSKVVLESWNNVSLDPNQPNYIEAVIGNQSIDVSNGYTNVTGDYTNKSAYVRVKSVTNNTLNYFDNNGTPKTSLTASVPVNQTGSFGGAAGTLGGVYTLPADAYTSSLNLLANSDEFRYNVITVPGITQEASSSAIALLTTNTSNRGDAIAIIDLVGETSSLATAVSEASEIDNSYAATYWPWVQVNAPQTGKLTWVPPSTIIPSVFAYNDRVAAPWFAPAGFTRGALSVIQAKRKLSPTDKDTLYAANINAIGTFPGQGVVAYGQKTLQKKASALDRINVRRLLIELKSYIGQVANTLVFEQNSNATRNRFLAQTNPYLESIKQREGLYAYKVVMDDTNNTADVIDRNQLVGQIFVQPTKTAEFIILDFNVTPTGATF
jgi:phage tail sheath protein FI